MTLPPAVHSSVATVGLIIAAMAAVALLETMAPLHARGRWHRAHLRPNLALTLLTFATNAFFNLALVLALVWAASSGFGLMNQVALPALVAGAIAVVVLDLSFYVAHVAMHKSALLWRFHRVHHSDLAVDVTTTIRQHPGEGVIRYVFMAGFALAIGAGPGAFAVYRLWSVLNGLLEHANVRVPRRLDALLAWVVVTPNMHKVHHSRLPEQTDTNYGNMFSFFDRIWSTFTPSERGLEIVYGLDGFDDAGLQTTRGLLAAPFRKLRLAPGAVAAGQPS